ncbi:MAG: flagellar hook-basal body complex protein [Hyphomicrobiales bacterium]|nr:flagellar hook-basal body complex protein [Hyphomicrobiales bacterium]
MSLYGALFSGVSGLTAQSSAMGAISDNITNVSTIGYKNTSVDFQTLVTKQTSTTFYSAGGVQSRPRGANDVQGLLQASTSQTDISISGSGYFVVNEASRPTISNQYLFTRAGSFYQDNEGFLYNTAGFYLQGWPVDAQGNVIPANDALTIANQNIISTDYLETVNLSRVGGTASATTNISIGANLPSNDAVGDTHRTDVQFFDTLGNANTISFVYTKAAANEWDLSIEPPTGTNVLTLYDGNGDVYSSTGQLEFTTQPATTDTVTINGTVYDFGSGAGAVTVALGTTAAATVSALAAAIAANDAAFGTGTTSNTVAVSAGSSTTLVFGNLFGGGGDFTVDPSGFASGAVTQATAFTVQDRAVANADRAIEFDSDGLPSAFNVAEIEILGFANGAADMDNATANSPRMDIDFGNVGEANGMTQFGAEFSPTFIQQNGSRFGTFAGVSIDVDGLMTALFDNGERRPIFKIPIATFVNPNGLEGRTGNVWNSTERSGDYTLRVADNGPAGQVIQAALEASTVDIGEEFTNMIVVQRAYSASTKIISTADSMLEELMRTKR